MHSQETVLNLGLHSKQRDEKTKSQKVISTKNQFYLDNINIQRDDPAVKTCQAGTNFTGRVGEP